MTYLSLNLVEATELFPDHQPYVTRSTREKCTRCGAEPGFMCFEVDYETMKAHPRNGHIVLLPVRSVLE